MVCFRSYLMLWFYFIDYGIVVSGGWFIFKNDKFIFNYYIVISMIKCNFLCVFIVI